MKPKKRKRVWKLWSDWDQPFRYMSDIWYGISSKKHNKTDKRVTVTVEWEEK